MQEWLVGLIVACAVWAVVKRYMPKAVRHAMRGWLAQAARRFGWDGIAARIAVPDAAAASCDDGCSSCGGCGPHTQSPSDERFVIKLKAMK